MFLQTFDKLLHQYEKYIDVKVLHHDARANKSSQKNFRETVFAIYDIIDQRLYKVKNLSVERYFRSRWDISRAQAYRFHTCATVIKVSSWIDWVMTIQELVGFATLPARERLCRFLKRFAVTAEERRRLWAALIECSRGNDSLLTSKYIENVHRNLKETKAIECSEESSSDNGEAASLESGSHRTAPTANCQSAPTKWSEHCALCVIKSRRFFFSLQCWCSFLFIWLSSRLLNLHSMSVLRLIVY